VGALIKARSPEVVLVAHSVDSFGYRRRSRPTRLRVRDRRLQAEAHRRRAGCDARRLWPKVSVELDFPAAKYRAARGCAPDVQAARCSRRAQVTARGARGARARGGKEFVELSAADDVDMTTAEFILSIGRGIGEKPRSRSFGIGGCRRRYAGLLEAHRRCGLAAEKPPSGTVRQTASACKLYIAMGVSAQSSTLPA